MTKQLKITFDATPLVSNKSGIGYYTHELVNALAGIAPDDVKLVGYYFNFLGRHSIPALPSAPNIKYAESRLVPGKLLNVCRRLGFQPPLELFTKQATDIALFPNYAALPSILKTKKVTAVHDLSFVDCPDYVSGKNRAFLQKWVPWSIKRASLIITISEFTKSRIKEVYGVSDEKIHITPIPPVAQEQPNFSIITKHELGNGYVLFVGTLEPRKNIIGLLEAYELSCRSKDFKLPLVLAGGKGWHDEEILVRVDQLQKKGRKIVLTGYVTDAERSALYSKSTFCILPSHYEGFGMPVLEAMQHGKAVACSDIPVLHEVAGGAGVYFNQDSPQAIADCINLLANNPDVLKKYEQFSKKRIKLYPSWEKVAKDLLTRLQELE